MWSWLVAAAHTTIWNMPELPEVEWVVRGLRPDVVGRTFTGVTFDWPRLIAAPTPDEFKVRVRGQKVKALTRRGKYIVFELSSDTLLVHLRMTGRFYVTEGHGEADKWVHVIFDMDDGKQLQYSDSRKFGRLHLLAQPDDVLGALGPEPLVDEFTLAVFEALIARRTGTLKPLLLNQAFVAGIGNIYADEALWRARIDPRRKADTLSAAEVEQLYNAIRTTLRKGIEYEGASINWYRKPDGSTGESQNHFNVYGRYEEPCPNCGGSISKITLGQRGTHFCRVCQN